MNLVVRKTALCGKIDKQNSTVTMVDSIKHAWAYLSAGVRGCESFSWLRQPRYGCRYEPLNVFPLLWYPVVKLPRVKEPRVDTLGDVWFEFRCDVDHLKKTRRKELVFIYLENLVEVQGWEDAPWKASLSMMTVRRRAQHDWAAIGSLRAKRTQRRSLWI